MRFHILMITHNRDEYTRLSLETLLERIPDNAQVFVWDNASNQATRDVLKSVESHPRIAEIHYHPENVRLWEPTAWLFEQSRDAEYLSKVDDDCLVPVDWCEILDRAHQDIPEAGILGCWRFPEEDFLEEYAKKKIQHFGKHSIMRNCWVEGSGYIMKRKVVDTIGDYQNGDTFAQYCIRAAKQGFINGWYFPFLYQEHMDDPRAEHTGIKTEEDFQRLKPLSAGNFGVDTIEKWTERLRHSARTLQMMSYDPDDFIGIRARVKRKLAGLTGKEYVPLVRG